MNLPDTAHQLSSDPAPQRIAPVPVLLTVRELDQGGVERDVAKIATHLDRTRFTPHVATFFANGFRYEELKAAGIPILHLPLRSLASVDTLRLAVVLFRYLQAHSIKIVHSYDASGIFILAVAQMARVPVVIGSQLSYRNILDSKTRNLLRISDRYSDAIFVNCEAIQQYMRKDEGVSGDKLELCYNGVLTDHFFPAKTPRPRELSSTDLVIGTVCALRPEKGLDILQEAFAKLHFPDLAVRLVIVGSGAELSRLRENTTRLGIAANSVFIPAQQDVVPWLRAMDIFVLPSLSEAFSNSLLEAMACGCCVVGSRVGGTPELIGENLRGLLFEPGNPQQLADLLTRLANDANLRSVLAVRAAAFARESLSIEIAAARTGAIYDRLLNKAMSTSTG